MDKILNLMNSTSFIIFIATIMITAFARCIIKIFRMGATFKTQLATKEEMRAFEQEIRNDMKSYAVQIQEIVTKSAMTVINNKLKDIDEAKQAVIDMKVMKTEIEIETKNALEKYDEIKTLSDSVRQLNARVQRLEYNSGTNVVASERRSEK